MAEGSMNPNTQEQMMLVQSFEQLANAVDADLPMAVQSEIAAVKEGKRMSEELQRMLAEGSMSFMNQLNPEMMQDTGMMDTGSAVRGGEAAMGMAGPGMSPETMADMVAQGQKFAIDNMTDAQRAIMQNEAYNRRLAKEMTMPSKGGMNYSPSSGVTMEPNVMTMEEAVDAGLVTPTRPRMRPAAPMQSPRPQARPMR
jgi:hypothetical protein